MPKHSGGSVLGLFPPGAAASLRETLTAAGLDVVLTSTLGELFRELERRAWTGTVVSLSCEHLDAEVLQRIAEHGSSGALILTAPAHSLQRAILAERSGAVALLREPVSADELRRLLDGALDEGPEVQISSGESQSEGTDDRGPDPVLIGESPAMAPVFEALARVARSDATVLLTGESGTGKEVAARVLHSTSERHAGPFVAVNCAAIPEHLLESELFGHEKGAFTGAVARRIGRFERAAGGTLFLDEIGDMSLVLQAKVLRALEERVIERVGGESSHAVDVRIVAATNQELGGAIREGRFREDLYYRLAVVEVRMPPLRERGDDLRTLALHFAAQAARRHGKPVRSITSKALRRLGESAWPGNVRELRNVMDRAVLLCHGSSIRSTDLRLGAAAPSAAPPEDADPTGYPLALSLAEVESDHVRRVLESVGGHMTRAAEMLGIHRNTLTRKIQEYGIRVAPSAEAAP